MPKEELIFALKDIDLVIDIFWICHIVKTFCTPYIKDVDIKDKCVDIAKKYLMGFFLFDVISTGVSLFSDSNPGHLGENDQVEYAAGEQSIYLSLYAIKLLRVFYFLKAIEIIKKIFDSIIVIFNVKKQTRNTFVSLIVLLYFLLYIMHLIACVWIYYGETQGDLSWKIYSGQMTEEEQQDQFTTYVFSLYWVVTTLTTVGYGDIYGKGTEQFVFTMVVEFLGILVFSIIMSSVNQALGSQGDIDIVENKID